MGGDEYGWRATLMLAVAVCERIELLAPDEAHGPLVDALTNYAGGLRDLAITELERMAERRS
jgi:hypothetical protein